MREQIWTHMAKLYGDVDSLRSRLLQCSSKIFNPMSEMFNEGRHSRELYFPVLFVLLELSAVCTANSGVLRAIGRYSLTFRE